MERTLHPQLPNRPKRPRRGGFTLTEIMVSLAVLAVTAVSGVSGFVLLNRYASDNRDRAAAYALCQERIDQMLTLPFRPQKGSVPTVTGQDNATYYVLGQSGDYSASTGAYTGASNQQTSNETVTVFKQADGNTLLTGTRTTTVTGSGVSNIVRGSVTVTYKLRNQTNTCTLYTLRCQD